MTVHPTILSDLHRARERDEYVDDLRESTPTVAPPLSSGCGTSTGSSSESQVSADISFGVQPAAAAVTGQPAWGTPELWEDFVKQAWLVMPTLDSRTRLDLWKVIDSLERHLRTR